jgi:hypothetical protein
MTHVTIEREALKTVLEALESCDQVYGSEGSHQYFSQVMVDKAITVAKQALAAPPVQESAKRVCSLGCKNLGACCAAPMCEAVATTPPAQPAPVQEPVVNSLMQRTLDLHNRCSMPWSDAAKLSLSEVGIDDARVHELAGNCSDTPMATLLNPDEIQDFTRSLLIYGSDLLHAATPPAAPVPLTDEQIDEIVNRLDPLFLDVPESFTTDFARAIEAAHGITGKGQP